MSATDLLLDDIRRNVMKHPDKLAIGWFNDKAEEVETLTFGAFHRRGLEIGAGLLKSGCTLGDPVLLVYPPGLAFFEAFLGCLYAGVTPIPTYPPDPINRDAHAEFLARLCERVGISHALTDTQYNRARRLGNLRNILKRGAGWPELTWVVTDTLKGGKKLPERHPDPDDVAFIQFTSGSTSDPKGVEITFGNLAHQLSLNQRLSNMTPESVGVVWLPQYHDFGLINSFLNGISLGFPVWFCSPFDFLKRPACWPEMMSKVKATHTGTPDFACVLLVRKTTPAQRVRWDLSSMVCVMWGAEPIRAATVGQFRDAFSASKLPPAALQGAYGLAENCVGVTVGHLRTITVSRETLEAQGLLKEVPEDAADAQALVGSGPVPEDTTLRIVDPKTLMSLPEGRIGEIWVRSGSTAKGYLGDGDATLRTFHATPVNEPNLSLLRTGDMGGVLDGELYCTSRLKEMIIVRGRNIYPVDVEARARGTHPLIRPGGIAALPWEFEGAESLAVVVELSDGAPPPEALIEVRDALRQALLQSGFPVQGLWLVKKGFLPKTTSGKLRRSLVSTWLNGGALDGHPDTLFCSVMKGEVVVEGASAPPSSLAETLDAISDLNRDDAIFTLEESLLSFVLSLDLSLDGRFSPETSFFEGGLDSLHLSELHGAIEAALGRAIDPREFVGLTSLRSIATWMVDGAHTLEEEDEPIEESSPVDPVLATSIQQLIWRDHRSEPGYALILSIDGDLTIDDIRASMAVLIARHDVLRARFEVKDGALWMVRLEAPPAPDVRALGEGPQPLDGLMRELRATSREPFDVGKPPLIRGAFGELEGGGALVGFAFHHLIYDAISVVELQREWIEIIGQVAGGKEPTIGGAPSYLAKAKALAEATPSESALQWWRQHLKGAKWPLPVPYDRPVTAFNLLEVGPEPLSASLLVGLKGVALSLGVTLNHILFTTWSLALGSTLEVDDVISVYPVSARGPQERDIRGPLVVDLPIRVRLGGGRSLEELIEEVSITLQEALAHSEVPYERILEGFDETSRGRLEAGALCPVLYSFLDWGGLGGRGGKESRGPWESGALTIEVVELKKPSMARPYDYAGVASLRNGALSLLVRVQEERVGRAAGVALMAAWRTGLEALLPKAI